MSYKSLTVETSNNIAHIRLNRPDKRNSMNADFWRELPEAVQQIDEQASARVIVLSSTGKHFCAGMDLEVFTDDSLSSQSELGRKHENLRRKVLQLQDIMSIFENVRMPTLAAIQGGCIGGGVDMVTACDIRYCTEDAFFSIEETKLAMTADMGTLQRLPHLISHGLTRELAYTGRRMYAKEAQRAGLVNQVFNDQEALIAGVMEVAAQIAARSPLAVTGCKEMLNYSRDHNVPDSLKYMASWQSGMFQPQTDMMETFSAKMEGRDPQFHDLNKVEPVV